MNLKETQKVMSLIGDINDKLDSIAYWTKLADRKQESTKKLWSAKIADLDHEAAALQEKIEAWDEWARDKACGEEEDSDAWVDFYEGNDK